MNEPWQITASSPGKRKVRIKSSMISLDPAPTKICSGGKPSLAASACTTEKLVSAGYRWTLESASRSAAIANGEGPRGFSLDASLTASVIPYSRSVSSIGFPGTYGSSVSMYGGDGGGVRPAHTPPPSGNTP